MVEVRPVVADVFGASASGSGKSVLLRLTSSGLAPLSSSTTTAFSTVTSGSIFDPTVTLASMMDLQLVTPAMSSSSFISEDNAMLNTPEPRWMSDTK